MITKKEIMLWLCKLDDDFSDLEDRIKTIENKLNKLEKGKKNVTTK